MRALSTLLLSLAIAGCAGGLPPLPSTAPGSAGAPQPAPPAALPGMQPDAAPQSQVRLTPAKLQPRPWRKVSGKRATASTGSANLAVDGNRETEWNPRAFVTPDKPQWLALPVEASGSASLAIVWHGHGMHYQQYEYGKPRSYEVQVSSDSTDGADGTWTTVDTVRDNPVRSRINVFRAPGAEWVRLRFLDAWEYHQMEPFLREVEVYAVDAQEPADVWLVMGDSVTSVALDPAKPDYFQAAVNRSHSAFTPVLLSGGVGGDEAANAVKRLEVALPTLPPGSVVGLCYGSNDAARRVPVADYKARLAAAIDLVRDRGHHPVLAVVPWSLNGKIAEYAQACRELTEEKGLPEGPDFQAYFKAHPDELQVDKVHPNATGIQSMQRLWAEAAGFRYGSR